MLKLTIPADSSFVGVARSLVTTLLERLGLADDDVYDASLVLGEMCSNVVRHAYDEPHQNYDVEVTLAQRRLTITVTDHGRGLNRLAVAEPTPEQPNGWGLWLIDHLADRVTVTRNTPSGTSIVAEMELGRRRTAAKPLSHDVAGVGDDVEVGITEDSDLEEA